MNRILLLGGTSESRWISRLLLDRGLEVYGSVTTSSAEQLFSEGVKEIFVRQSRAESLQDFMADRRIEMILDATHPFAAQISKKAIELSKIMDIPYLRYERPSLKGHGLDNKVLWVKSLEDAAQTLSRESGNILVATGAKNVTPFLAEKLLGRTFFRLLPTEMGKSRAKEHGLENSVWWDGSNPTQESVGAFLKAKAIRAAVVKDSGPQGISLILSELCPAMKIRLLILERPILGYPLVCSNAQDLEKFLDGVRSSALNL